MSLQGQHRHITLRHERHLLRGTKPALAPGETRISSYYLPALPAGLYSFDVEQVITAPTGDLPQKASAPTRKIEVLATEWALSTASNGDSDTTNSGDEESAVVLSVFPASGQIAPYFTTLPHMVLRDAQLPWLRTVSEQTEDKNNSIPWFALIVFSADELELNDKDRGEFFGSAGATINDTLGWDVTVDKLEKIQAPGLANFIPDPLKPDVQSQTRTSVLAVKADVFRKLFPPRAPKTTFDVSPYRFMSHVRTVATEGTLSAGIVADNDHDPKLAGTQTLSVVVSHRLGPADIQVPTPVLAHLVSLQGIDGTDVSVLNGKTHVLMTSLFSWTYTALPPGAPDVVSMLQHLGTDGKGLSVLRTDMGEDPQETHPSKEAELVAKRQKDGFNLVRHRVITGEETAAMYRGPLTPTRVPYPLNKTVSFQSNFGTDLQILDPNLGLMDISYASAWQLGKTLAMADPAFTAALARLRMLVHREAVEKSRKKTVEALRAPRLSTEEESSAVKSRLSVFSDQNPHITYMPKEEIKSDVTEIVDALNSINETVHQVGTAFSTNRWRRRGPLSPRPGTKTGAGVPLPTSDDLLRLSSPHVYNQLPEHALSHTLDHASAPDEKGPYNYHTIPNNTDYAVIQEWILDKLHLSSIPAHYYLPDPSYVPEETLRFFHIDHNWTDALVDGALSLANHLASTPEEDFCRSALKKALNRYLECKIVGDYAQQMPAYGFILRSKLLVQFPDLAVSAEFSKDGVHSNEDWDKVKPRAPILVQRRLGPDMMLVLMDREPPQLSAVTFTLPAHQQTFIAAFRMTIKDVTLQCKRIYATGAYEPLPEPDREKRQIELDPPKKKITTDEIFDWDARMLKIEDYAQMIHDNLEARMPNEYLPKAPTSAVFSLQLNEPIYTLNITAQRPKLPPSVNQEDLESWTVLHEPRLFRFFPPAFPTLTERPEDALAAFTACERPQFTATRLKVTEHPQPPNRESTAAKNGDVKDDFEVIELHGGIAHPPSSPEGPVLPTAKPEFEFRVFPIGKKEDDYIPCNSGRPIDLVFSIVRKEGTTGENWPLRIMRWDLIIKIGDPDKEEDEDPGNPTTSRAFLRNDKEDGPPPVMLSNLRYNVLIQKWDMEEKQLYISIVPRSSWGVHMTDTPDASFLLPMAHVYPWKISKGSYYSVKVALESTTINQNDDAEEEVSYVYTEKFKLRNI